MKQRQDIHERIGHVRGGERHRNPALFWLVRVDREVDQLRPGIVIADLAEGLMPRVRTTTLSDARSCLAAPAGSLVTRSAWTSLLPMSQASSPCVRSVDTADSIGTSFMRHVLARRLDRARAALHDPARSARTITDLALDLGFRDPSYFGRTFKSAFGVTPRDGRAAAGASVAPPP